jgi:hypothetical protein
MRNATNKYLLASLAIALATITSADAMATGTCYGGGNTSSTEPRFRSTGGFEHDGMTRWAFA